MRAIVIHRAKDLRIEEHETPRAGPGQVLVRVAAGGICGSDLHYYNHGGIGQIVLKEPMVLGHEVSGRVEALGEGVAGLARGDLVAIHPSRPCGTCRYCLEGAPNHCLDMKFYGSAMPFPHVQGAFRELLVVEASQCIPADGLSDGEAAMGEPLAVALHATRQAGDLLGKKVLVAGCGPIGCLCIMAARRAGAAEIVATDVAANALTYAEKAGADRTVDMAGDPDGLAEWRADKGQFDVFYECSGAVAALTAGLAVVRPRGIVVQLGLGGDMTVPMGLVTAKELSVRGSFRFHAEFPLAVEFMRAGLIDVRPLISHTVPLADAENAFATANDRSQAMKTLIAFG